MALSTSGEYTDATRAYNNGHVSVLGETYAVVNVQACSDGYIALSVLPGNPHGKNATNEEI